MKGHIHLFCCESTFYKLIKVKKRFLLISTIITTIDWFDLFVLSVYFMFNFFLCRTSLNFIGNLNFRPFVRDSKSPTDRTFLETRVVYWCL